MKKIIIIFFLVIIVSNIYCGQLIECDDYMSDYKSDFYLWLNSNNFYNIKDLLSILLCEASVKKVEPKKLIEIFKNDTQYFKQILDIYEKFDLKEPIILKFILISLKNNFSSDFFNKILESGKDFGNRKEYYLNLNKALYFFIVCKSNNVELENRQISEISYLIFKNKLDVNYVNRIINILLKIRGKYKNNTQVYQVLKEGIEKRSNINMLEENIKLFVKDY